MTIFLSVLFKLPIKRNHFHLFIYYSFFVALKEFRDNFLLYCFTRLTFHKPPEWSLIYGESVTSIVTSDYSSFSTKSSSLSLVRFKHLADCKRFSIPFISIIYNAHNNGQIYYTTASISRLWYTYTVHTYISKKASSLAEKLSKYFGCRINLHKFD